MGKDIRLNSSEWIDFVFEGKNHKYGAYQLRNKSGRGHLYALGIVLLLMIVLVVVSISVSARKQQQRQEQFGSISTTVELTNIEDLDIKLPEETVAAQEDVPPPPKLRETVMFTAPVIEDDDKVSSANQMKSQTTLQQSATMISIADIEGSNDLDAVDIADLRQIKVEVDTEKMMADNRLYDRVDQMPQFPGGASALANFIASNVKYPKESAERSVEGRVVLGFVVEKDGTIGDIRVVQSVDAACDAEAIRVIKIMPRWEPGKHQGKAVRVWFTQPIAFELR